MHLLIFLSHGVQTCKIYKFQTGWDYAGHLDRLSGRGILSKLSGLSHKNRDGWSPYFTYVTTRSSNLPSLYLHHSSFSNPSITSPTSQFILQPFFHFFCITSSSLNSPGEPPILIIIVAIVFIVAIGTVVVGYCCCWCS